MAFIKEKRTQVLYFETSPEEFMISEEVVKAADFPFPEWNPSEFMV